MTDTVREIAPAKVNLALHVGPRRDDGYHPIRSLMVALDGLADTVTMRPAPQRRVVCPGIPERDNLVWRALDVLERLTGRALDVHVEVDKRIPSPAGLGGGSSDAAAAMRAARALCGLDLSDDDLEEAAADIGSDVPFFVRGGSQWAHGRGEVLRPAAPPRFEGVVLAPTATLATRRVYAAFDRLPPPAARDHDELAEWWRSPAVRNDLWPAALACAPRLGAGARRLSAEGADRVLLCGSGGALIGLWRDANDADAAYRRLGSAAIARVRPRHGT